MGGALSLAPFEGVASSTSLGDAKARIKNVVIYRIDRPIENDVRKNNTQDMKRRTAHDHENDERRK